MPVISISDLQFTWPGAQRPTLQIADLQIDAGDTLFLQGSSGSGKSTLLGLLAGTLTARQGQVKVLDTDLASLNARRRDRFRARHIGIVFQQFNLIPFLTVANNLRLAARFAWGAKADTEARATQLIESLRLDRSILQRRADRLSVGQQQRVAIARALINEPELLLADEPTSALDANARDHFMNLLLSVREMSGCTIVFVSHDAALAKYFNTRLALSEINQAREAVSDDV